MATKRSGPEVREKNVSQKKKTKAEEKKSWSDDEVGDLIDLFENKLCLCNIHDPSYAKRDERELAYSSIAEQFETTIQTIKAKLNGLRTQFGRKISKCLKVRANGTTNKAEMLDENIGRFAPGLTKTLKNDIKKGGALPVTPMLLRTLSASLLTGKGMYRTGFGNKCNC